MILINYFLRSDLNTNRIFKRRSPSEKLQFLNNLQHYHNNNNTSFETKVVRSHQISKHSLNAKASTDKKTQAILCVNKTSLIIVQDNKLKLDRNHRELQDLQLLDHKVTSLESFK